MRQGAYWGVSFNMDLPILLRLMVERDIASVMRIQSEAYAENMREAESVIRARLLAVPDTTWVVEQQGEVVAYLVAYKSHLGQVSPWGAMLSHKSQAKTLYVHDLALGTRVRGLRLGHWLMGQVIATARSIGMHSIALVSVQDSQGFWQKMEFHSAESLAVEQHENLATYAGQAVYMTRTLNNL